MNVIFQERCLGRFDAVHLEKGDNDLIVVAFSTSEGPYAEELREAGIEYSMLDPIYLNRTPEEEEEYLFRLREWIAEGYAFGINPLPLVRKMLAD